MKVELWYYYLGSEYFYMKLDEGITDANGDYTFTNAVSWTELLIPYFEMYNMIDGINVCVRVYPESTTFKVANGSSSIINFAGDALFDWQIIDDWLDPLLSYNIVSDIININNQVN